jgi:hypothetical protein
MLTPHDFTALATLPSPLNGEKVAEGRMRGGATGTMHYAFDLMHTKVAGGRMRAVGETPYYGVRSRVFILSVALCLCGAFPALATPVSVPSVTSC